MEGGVSGAQPRTPDDEQWHVGAGLRVGYLLPCCFSPTFGCAKEKLRRGKCGFLVSTPGRDVPLGRRLVGETSRGRRGGYVDVHTMRVACLSALWSRWSSLSREGLDGHPSSRESVGVLLLPRPGGLMLPNVGLKQHWSKYRPLRVLQNDEFSCLRIYGEFRSGGGTRPVRDGIDLNGTRRIAVAADGKYLQGGPVTGGSINEDGTKNPTRALAPGITHTFSPKVIFVPSPPPSRIFPCNPPTHL